MKAFLSSILLLLSIACLSQTFGIKEKEQLVFQSLKAHGFVSSKSFRTWPVIYVQMDTIDEPVQNFIKEKFPQHNWCFFDEKQCQEIFKDLCADSLVNGFTLSMWNHKEAWYFQLAFMIFKRDTYYPYGNYPGGWVSPSILCGSPPDGRLKYNSRKKKWEFADEEKMDKETRKARF